MKKIINIYKPAGFSPLEAIKAFREQNSEYRELKMTYAGRLDPLAEGVLLVLAGSAVHKKDEYLALDKEYEADVLFGFTSDTYDVLGIPECGNGSAPSQQSIKKEINKIIGETELSLPPFSSYKIKGRPLFEWARRGRLDDIEIPKRKITVYEAYAPDFYEINSKKLLAQIIKKINSVSGDFRQKEIKKQWENILSKSKKEYFVAKIKFKVSSGTYIRSIADKLGEALGLGAVLFNLKRISAGKFNINDSIKLSK